MAKTETKAFGYILNAKGDVSLPDYVEVASQTARQIERILRNEEFAGKTITMEMLWSLIIGCEKVADEEYFNHQVWLRTASREEKVARTIRDAVYG